MIARGRNVMAGYWEDEQATAETIKDGWFYTGDLGRIDEKGNLYLVGRSKDVIVDSNGKNVYPDEIEDLYRDSPYIKDLSVVGLPDGSAEQVACAIMPAYDHDATLARADVEARVQEHFRKVSAELPFWKRVKIVHIWDGELPRTAKRSVKRRDIVAELERLRRRESEGALAAVAPRDERGTGWLLDLVATVSGKPRGDVHLQSRLGDLGFDSLMYTELASALENEGIALPEDADLTAVVDVAQLQDLVVRSRSGAGSVQRLARRRGGDEGASAPSDADIHVPSAVATAGKRGLALAQRLFYKRVLDTRISGRQPRSAPHPLHRRGQSLLAPGHGAHQGGAGRVGPRSHVAGGGRLLLPQQVPARVFQALHQPGADGAHRIDPQVDGHRGEGAAPRAQHGGVPRGDALDDRPDGRLPAQPGLSRAARRGGPAAGVHLGHVRVAAQGGGGAEVARSGRGVRAVHLARAA